MGDLKYELSDKKKDVIRFAIVGLGAVFIIVMVKILTKKRQ
jgi:putative flippase GtrA